MKRFLSIVALAVLLSAGAGYSFAQQRAAVPGYYKDIFMDGGVKVTSLERLPASEWLGLSMELLTTQRRTSTYPPTLEDTLHQNKIFIGSPEDLNGPLLYPDGAPRFRMIYLNGGKATGHGGSLGEQGRQTYKDFIKAGGSLVGSCAGAFMSSKGTATNGKYSLNEKYTAIWPGWTHSTGLNNSQTDMFVPEESPLNKYYKFPNNHIEAVRHNGGCYMYEKELPKGTEVLTLFDYEPKTANGTRSIHKKAASWAWKENSQTGRIVLCGSHPEAIESGDRLMYMSAMVQYALEGTGEIRLKGELENGKAREMYKSTYDHDPDFTMIGDRQYHHFKFTLPEGAKNVTVTLKGENCYDLFLYLNKGEFAFRGQCPFAEMAHGAEKTMTFESLEAGEWYLSVECDTTVETLPTRWGFDYVGDTTVLNGVPYSISVSWE